MKIIDLLVKISKGEEVPKRIKYQNEIYTYANDDYCTTNEKWLFSESYTEKVAWLNDFLNDEVEVMDNEEEKEIEKLGYCCVNKNGETRNFVDVEEVLKNKINELIDVINDMRDKE